MRASAAAREIMIEFADRTGLTADTVKPRRYLWTDAFGVCNYLSLFRETGDRGHLETARKLVDQVHSVLGRHREDDPRRGWLSGLDGDEARRHPTRGGLRIGKAMNERGADEPYDENLEWERDGQYFHYLTKWMHALDCIARATHDAGYALWALELAKAAHAAFTYTQPVSMRKLMYWKLSIDLSYPLVTSMGQHDPLDGLITYEALQATAARFTEIPKELGLNAEIADLATMCEAMNWATDDPLGIGGLLADACRLAQLIVGGRSDEVDRLSTMLADAEVGLDAFARRNRLDGARDYRLAFRELGLSIGLHGLAKMREMIERYPEAFANRQLLQSRLARLSRYGPLAETIEDFWLEPGNRQGTGWLAHVDINSVMLATSLVPDGYLIVSE